MQLTHFFHIYMFLQQLIALTRKNIIIRYKHSLLGFLWGFLKPAMYLCVFIVIFGAQFNTIHHYVLFATGGIIYWFLFSNIVNQSISSLLSGASLIKSIKINALLFPIADTLCELYNFVLALLVFLLLMFPMGIIYGWHLLLLIPATLLWAFFALGVGVILASLNVYFRDIGILWNTIQPALFYLTPIAYVPEWMPHKYIFVLKWNPLFYFITLSRNIIYEQKSPELNIWIVCIVCTLFVMSIAFWIFKLLKNQFITAI